MTVSRIRAACRLIGHRRLGGLCLAGLVLAGKVPHGQPAATAVGNKPAPAAAPDCTTSGIAQKRTAAERQMKAGAPAQALAILERLHRECPVPGFDDDLRLRREYLWAQSDLAYAYYRVGDYARCMSLLAPLTYGRPDYFMGISEASPSSAVEYNYGLCEAAAERSYKGLSDAACPDVPARRDEDTGEQVQDGILLPAEASEGGRLRCLYLKPGAKREAFRRARNENPKVDPDKLCPKLFALGRDKAGQPLRLPIAVDEGHISSTSDCCNVTGLSAGMLKGRRIVRLQGRGRDCFGSTADIEIDEIYEWRGTKLTLVKQQNRVLH